MAHSSERSQLYALLLDVNLQKSDLPGIVQVEGVRLCTDGGFLCSRADVCVVQVTLMIVSDFLTEKSV